MVLAKAVTQCIYGSAFGSERIRIESQALDGGFVKVLYIVKFRSVWYLFVRFWVGRPGNREVTIYHIALS